MSIFDVLTGAQLSAFGDGASAIFTPPTGSPVSVPAVKRRERGMLEQVIDGYPQNVETTFIEAPRNATVAAPGWTVTVSVAPGRTFRVQHRVPGANPAADGLDAFVLEDVTP